MLRVLWIGEGPKEVVPVSTLEALRETLKGDPPFDLVLIHTWEGNREGLRALLDERLPGVPVYEVGPFCVRPFGPKQIGLPNELCHSLIEAAPALMVIWQDERLVFFNGAVLATTGYSEEELQNTPIWNLVHPKDRELVKSRGLARLKGKDVPSRYTFRILTKEGEVRWLDWSAARVEIGGRPAALGVGLDITEDKEREKTLEALAQLNQALRRSEELHLMMESALDALLEVMEAEAGAVFLFGGDPPHLVAKAGRGWMENLPAPPRSEEGSLAGLALRGEVVLSPNLKEDPRVGKAERPLTPEGWAGMALPIPAGERPVGVLLLAWPEGRLPTPKEVERAKVLLETLGNALRRAHLRERLAKQVERLQGLHRAGQAVLASLALEPSLEVLLNQAFLTQVDAAALFLLDPRSKTLQLKAHRGFRFPPPKEIPLGQGDVGRAVLLGEVVAVDDLAQRAAHSEWTGREGFVAGRAYPLLARGKAVGGLVFFTRRPWDLDSADEDFLRALAGQAALALESLKSLEDLLRAQRELEASYELTLWGWAKAVELRDQETAGHTERVTALTLRLAQSLGVAEEDYEHIRRGAILHDVGKIAIPDRILLKPGPLTEEEWEVMKRHPVYAYEWLSGIPFLRKALDIPYAHHERWDGTGYPRGLKGEAIPLFARIFAVADVYDALTSDRPYHKAWPREKALAYLREEAGRQFDPQVVEAFLALMAETASPEG